MHINFIGKGKSYYIPLWKAALRYYLYFADVQCLDINPLHKS